MLTYAKINDLDEIMIIIEDAKVRMKADNLIQWQDGYPNRETIQSDLEVGQLFKYTIDQKIAGICVINDDYYKQYSNIPPQEECLMIHRFAISKDYLNQGIGKKLLSEAINLIEQNNRLAVVDTNSNNIKMIKLIEAVGFSYVSDFELVKNAPAWKLFIKK